MKAVALAMLARAFSSRFGVSAMNPAGSDISRCSIGAPTDRAMWMLAGGIVAIVIGPGGLVSGSRNS